MDLESQPSAMSSLTTLRGLLFALLTLTLASCAQREPGTFARDDYFGGQGNLRNPNRHVPTEVQRVEPWFPLF